MSEINEEKGNNGSAGFRIGIQDELTDYRARLLYGKGVEMGVDISGKMWIDSQSVSLNFPKIMT